MEVSVCPQEVHEGVEGKGLPCKGDGSQCLGRGLCGCTAPCPASGPSRCSPGQGWRSGLAAIAVKERGQKGSKSSNREFPDAYRCEIQSFLSQFCPRLNLVVSVSFFPLKNMPNLCHSKLTIVGVINHRGREGIKQGKSGVQQSTEHLLTENQEP